MKRSARPGGRGRTPGASRPHPARSAGSASVHGAMLRRPGSPLAVFNALALTTATLFAGAWDSSGHGHDPIAANVAYCVVDHEAEASDPAGRATLSRAAASHDHTCVACQLGRTKTVEDRKTSIAGPLDLASAASASDRGPGPNNGERWRHTARGPPPG